MSSNRLAPEASPYLRLHASNPVDWYPWGEAAFQRARERDVPIFLSIGYFTCHWCHVMERESFASPELAERLNRDFVSIKVDREERPDVDRLYMAFVQATTGSGGWPLSAFLTPDLVPFYGGTYFPPRDRHGMPGFARVLEGIAQAWRTDRPRLLASASEIGNFLKRAVQPPPAPADFQPSEALANSWPALFHHFQSSYDPAQGGFGGAPKFPRPAGFAFLLRYARRHRGRPEAAAATAMVVDTLKAMAAGGIHDALAGGFHRYSVDAGWRVPHFEKMLYDQAQIAIACVEAWQLTHDPELELTARHTLDFVLREMASPEGGYYSALDADSPLPEDPSREGEGAFYLWTRAEIETELGAEAADFCAHFGVLPQGNVPPGLDPQGEFTGKNILYGSRAPKLDGACARLRRLRAHRPHPPTDTKVLTAWNALMISALARAAAAWDDIAYLEAARAVAHFLREHRTARGKLLRTATVPAFVEDYAYLIQALLDLHQADFDRSWLAWARLLQTGQDAQFAAPEGGYYSSGADPHLWLRLREDYDGAEPSPNSVAAANLQRLAALFDEDTYRQQAESLLASFAARLASTPEALPFMAAALETAAAAPRRVTLAGDPNADSSRALLRVVRDRFLPGWELTWEPASQGSGAAYVCANYVCQLPLYLPAELAAALD